MQQLLAAGDRQAIRVLKALGDPKRFRMFKAIAAAGELSCSQVGRRFSLAQPTISHHLKILYDASLLQVREDGPHHYISVNQPQLRIVLEKLPQRLIPRRAGRARRGAAVGSKPQRMAQAGSRSRARTKTRR